MANAPLLMVGNDSDGSATTDFFGSFQFTTGTLARNPETGVQLTCRIAGKLKNLGFSTAVNTRNGINTIISRLNTANGAMTISVPTSTTGNFVDSVNTDTVASGDIINLQRSDAGSSGSINFNAYGCSFAATSNTDWFVGTVLTSTTATTLYFALSNPNSGQVTEANAQHKLRIAGIGKKLYCNIPTNSTSGAGTFISRKNTANGALTLSITAGTTGIFEDTTHSDTLASGDLYNFALTYGAISGSISSSYGALTLETTDGTSEVYASQPGLNEIIAPSTTLAYGLTRLRNISDSEAAQQSRLNYAATCAKLRMGVSINTITNASTFTFRKNGANGNQTVSITGNTTGFFEDTVNTDSTVSSDVLNYQLVTGSGGVHIEPDVIAMRTDAVAAVVTSLYRALLGVGI